MTREQLEEGRHKDNRTYGYLWSFCDQTRSCEECDRVVRLGCKIQRKIEDIQTKRILRICR